MKGLLAIFLFLPVWLTAQNYLMNGTPISSCSGTFYDSGGPAGGYANNQNLSTTICAGGVGGTHVRLSFSGADLAAGDVLCFYDGPNAASTLLSCSSDYPAGQPFVIQATATNPSGCITVVFQSNATGTASGWAAAISCVASCQTILADLVSSNPATLPVDTGWIDICPGQRVFFTGAGLYPQNDFVYHQSDFSTRFEWNFGDGAIAYGPVISHRFDQAGGYFVQLVLTDTLGCKNTNLISQRIRVAPKPDFELTSPSQICMGDTLELNSNVTQTGSGSILSALPSTASFSIEASRADSLPLPDGTGELYETSILFTEFSPGQIMVSENDLESICVNMEHSWMRDMDITLSCPSGQKITLHDHPGNIGAQVWLGQPNDNDNFNPIPGLGYDYCWTPSATNGTWITYANTVLGGSGTLPSGNYSTFDPISDLIGCPLNGEWTIGVTDHWAADNGYIFNWSMKFREDLYPGIETFTPQFVEWHWNDHPSIFYYSSDSIAVSPQNAGTAGYSFTVTDDYGCSWDTLLSVPVLPFTHPDCYVCDGHFAALQDVSTCAGDAVQLDATSSVPAVQEIRFEAFPDYRLGNGNHPPANPYQSPIDVSSLGYNFLSNPIQQITSVCMDIETDFDADLNISLRGPGGQQLVLSTGNGGGGDNYKVTCFSPSASQSIIGQAAPFNGTYMPEGNWNALAGAQINGDWSLVVSDGFAPAQFGKVKWWSIGFNAQNNVVYNWTNNASLSCTTCPNPIANPLDTTIYILTATDAHNCVHRDTALIAVHQFFPAPDGLMVFGLGAGTMTWTWNAVQSALGYEVSIDGGPWQSPNNGALSHIVSGLAVGQNVQISVRSISPTSCVPAVSSDSSAFPVCTMFAGLFSTTDLLCSGDSTGSAILSVSNATSPVLFYLDTNPTPFPNGDFINILSEGLHDIIVLDDLGCRDTVTFTLNAPPPIVVMASGTDVRCNGDNSGVLAATASGGMGNFGYVWRDCLGGPTLGGAAQSNLFAGCYTLTVTDANGCTQTGSVTLNEPLPYVFVPAQDSVSCFGLSDGSASLVVSGGTLPYQYLWDSGASTSLAGNLPAGTHFVTVTDANLCAATTFVEVFEPPALVVDDTQMQFSTCFGGNNGTATVLVIGGTKPYTYLWSDGQAQTTQKAVSLGAGTYTVTVTDWNTCSITASVTVTSPPALQLNFTNVQAEICSGDCLGQATVNASGGVGGFQFDWADPAIPDGTQTATNLCPGTYRITLTDGNGCTQSAQVMINAALPLDVHFTGTEPSCAGLSDGMIQLQVSGGTQPYGYLWSNGNTTANPQNLACGDYSLTLTDAAGCVKSYTTHINCPQTILISNLLTGNINCFGGTNGFVEVQATGGTMPLSYTWSDPMAQITPRAQNLSAGMYTVTITDANGCNTAISATLTEPVLLMASTTNTDVSCLNFADGTATATANGGVAPYTYSWGAAGTDQLISKLTAGVFFVTVTDANACTATASATINQPLTGVMVSPMQTRFACKGESDGEAAVSASGSNGAPFTFIWSNGQVGGGASNLATGLYTVTATDAKGCTGSEVLAIQELDSITLLTAYAPPSCAGDADGVVAVVLIEGGLGMGDSTQYHYQWSLPGAPDATIAGGFSGGNYNLTVTDFQGCTGILNFDVVAPLPIALQLSAEDASCFGFQDGSIGITGVQNAVGTLNYQWSNGASAQQIDSLQVGNYRVTVTDSKGCTQVAAADVHQPSLLELSFQTMPLVCTSDSNASIMALISGGTPQYSYQWNTGNGTAAIDQLGPGVYALEVRDQNGCMVTDSIEIVQPNPLTLSLETTEPECFGAQNGRIRLTVTGGKSPFKYSLNGGDFGGTGVFIALGAGDYFVQIMDANGCLTGANATLNQPLPVQVTVGLDTAIVLGDSLLLTATVNNAVGLTSFEWSSVLRDSFRCADLPDCEEIWVIPGNTNTYRLKVTDENGCFGKDEIRITVEKPRGVYVPNGFSPNGDLENDLLVVHGKSRQVKNIRSFRIFDRWGELVYTDQNFQVNDLSRGWDGNFRGQPSDPAVFVWILEAEYIDGHVEVLNGNVTLIR